MRISTGQAGDDEALVGLFAAAFGDAEGPPAGGAVVAHGRGHRAAGVGGGQALLRYALDALAAEYDAAVTYGDPRYYGKLGFLPITEARAAAPLPLSMPHGWLGRALPAGLMPGVRGPSRCAEALMRPDIW